jgi:hypothetical protein
MARMLYFMFFVFFCVCFVLWNVLCVLFVVYCDLYIELITVLLFGAPDYSSMPSFWYFGIWGSEKCKCVIGWISYELLLNKSILEVLIPTFLPFFRLRLKLPYIYYLVNSTEN